MGGLLFLLTGSSASAKPQITPIINLEVYGGQTRFNGDKGSFYGNGSWSLAPVLSFGDKTTLIPSYSGLIRRTVMVQELVGGSLLTQSEQDHNFNLTAIHRINNSPWKAKARIGFKRELIRESNDEGWGDGLFDNDKTVAGFEFEREGGKVRSFRTGLEYFYLRYPNFQSLASQEFGTEISGGKDVLDLDALDWLTSVDLLPSKKNIISLSFLLSPRYYRDAKVVEDTGLFSDKKRRDWYYWAAGNAQHLFNPASLFKTKFENTVGFYTSLALNKSNQNNMDAAQTQFNRDYYSYTEWAAGPRFNTKIADKWDVGFGYTFSQRLYANRPLQSKEGTYVSGKVNTEVQLYSFDLAYLLTKSFSINTSVAYQVAKSNQKYEKTYQYNYDSSHYFLGFSYSY